MPTIPSPCLLCRYNGTFCRNPAIDWSDDDNAHREHGYLPQCEDALSSDPET